MKTDLLPLSGAQRNVWFHQLIDPTSVAYNIGQIVYLDGLILPSVWIEAQNKVWACAESLRARFVVVDGKPFQEIVPGLNAPFEQTDLRSEANIQAVLKARIKEHQLRCHDLGRGPCCRFALFQIADSRWVWSMAIHHLVCDAPAGAYVTALLAKTYKEILENNETESSLGLHDWKQAIESDSAYQSSDRYQKDRDYWLLTLEGLEKPVSIANQDTNTLSLAVPENAFHSIARDAYDKFASWSIANGQSLYAGFATAFCIYSSRLTGETDLCIGGPTSGRNKKTRNLIGMLSNVISLRLTFDPAETVLDLLTKAARQNRQNLRHNSFPIAALTQERRKRGLGSPFSMVVNLLAFDQRLDFGTAIGTVETLSTGSIADLQLNIFDRNDGGPIDLRLDFNPTYYSFVDIEKHLERIGNLILSLPELENTPIAGLSILRNDEEQKLIASASGLQKEPHYAHNETIVDKFYISAEQHSYKPALHYVLNNVAHALTYQELNQKSNQLARLLIQQGATTDKIIAVLLERSVEQIVSMLAILKTGAAYLPIDPEYPQSRQAFMLSDSGACAIITQSTFFHPIEPLLTKNSPRKIFLDDPNTITNINSQVIQNLSAAEITEALLKKNLAYLIYTSGSTGKPKGAGNTHEAILNRLEWMQDILKLKATDRVLQKTGLGFDVAVWEWYLPLMAGASLVVSTPQGHKDPRYLKQVIEQFEVTVLHFVPSILSVFLSFLSQRDCPSLKQIVTSGEALSAELQNETFKQFPKTKLWNLYGPTEAAIDVSFWECEQSSKMPPIGHPIWNTQLYILDSSLDLLPEGCAGELYIAGIGLARGYLGRCGLTAERFIACPFGTPGARMYRTGDLARRRTDGALEYLGRLDDQVKIRGYRIELGEIEASLLTENNNLAQVAVISRKLQGDQRLIAYVVPRNANASLAADELREKLLRILPEHMVPAHFVSLDALPLSANGKLDRRALPDPIVQTVELKYRAARNSQEALLCKLFAEITGVEHVGIDDGFFALGAHSLLAMRLIARLRQEANLDLSLAKLFEYPTPELLAPHLQTIASNNEIELRPEMGHINHNTIALSYGQSRLWTLDRVDGASATYNIAVAIDLKGHLDVPALSQALLALIDRHQALRTTITESEDGAPMGRLLALPNTQAALNTIDLSAQYSKAPDQAETHLQVLLQQLAAKPFALHTDLPLRAYLISTGDEHHVLALIMHHHAVDGASVNILARELGQAYRAYHSGKKPDWPVLTVQYSDWAFWQKQSLQENIQPKLERARQRLNEISEPLALPLDYPRTAHRARRAGYLPIEIPAHTVLQLETLALTQATTLFTVVLSIYAATLARISGQNEVVIGAPVSGRHRTETESMVGLLVNTIALPLSIADNCNVESLIQRCRDTVQLALNDQDLPFEQLVESLNIERSLTHSPVFQAMLAFQTDLVPDFQFDNIVSRSTHIPLPTAKFELIVFIGKDSAGNLSGNVEYDADLFAASSVHSWIRCFVNLAKNLTIDTQVPVKTIAILDSNEREQTLASTAGRLVQSDQALLTLPDMLDVCSQSRSQVQALVYEISDIVHSLTYAELESRSNRLARYLIAQGIGPDDIVGIFLNRSADMIIAMISVLKAGAAYLPMDPELPESRLNFMLKDCGAKTVITRRAHLSTLQSSDWVTSIVIDSDDTFFERQLAQYSDSLITQSDRIVPLLPKHLAYVIYTSGSTGVPKGVGNSHEAVVNHMVWMQSVLSLGEHDLVLQKTAIGFDVAVWEWFLPLVTGASLVIATPEGHKDPTYLIKTIERFGITVIHFVASMLGMFIEERESKSCSSLKQIVTSGEALTGALQAQTFQQFPQIALWDLYGPTEAAIHVAQWCCRPEEGTQTPPIGYPIWNTQLFILDALLEPTPDGVVGELYVAGKGLARGYIGRASLTAERFIANPFDHHGTRLYRTGDLARKRLDGAIEYLGRTDDQVKIRGYRIELGEIETTLLQAVESLGQVAVIAKKINDDNRLIAYYVPKAGFEVLGSSEIRGLLRTTLPDYMIPTYLVRLDALPLTPNGKLDRRALPEPSLQESLGDFREPRNESESFLCALFGEICGFERVSIDDSFFKIGGHSLLAMRLVAQIRQRLGITIPLRVLFESPTPELLAPYLQAINLDRDVKLLAGMGSIDKDTITLSYGQSRLWTLDRVDGASATYNMAAAIDLRGYLDIPALRQALVALIERHQVLRTVITESEDGTPIGRLVALPDTQSVLTTLDLSDNFDKEPNQADANLQTLLGQLASKPFALHNDMPLRVHLISTRPNEYVLVFVMHHHAGDGESVNIFARDLDVAYRAYRSGKEPNWRQLTVQYSDWAAWQQKTLQATIEAKLERVKERLKDMPGLLTLPVDYPRTAQRARRASYLPVEIPTRTVVQLEALALAHDTTLFTIVLAIYAATLSRIAGQNEIVIGAPVAGRNHALSENMVGFLLNTLALPLSISNGSSGLELIKQCRQTVQDALDDQDVPFERLLDSLNLTRTFLHTPVFQAMLAFQNGTAPIFALQDIHCSSKILSSNTSKFDLTLHLNKDTHGALRGSFEFDLDLFDPTSVSTWIDAFTELSEKLPIHIKLPLHALPLLSREAETQVIANSSGDLVEIPEQYLTFTKTFEAYAQLHPDAIALVTDDSVMTYQELDLESNRLARYLIKKGVKTDQVVGVLIKRSQNLIITILAIVKAGAAYLPLDPNYPSSRLTYMLKDSNAIALVCTHDHYLSVFDRTDKASLPALWFIDDPETITHLAAISNERITRDELKVPVTEDNLVYVMYTSGSTGTPKGVSFIHKALSNLVKWKQDFLPSGASRVLQYSPIGFDASAQEIASALSCGASLILIDEEKRRDPQALLEHMQRHQVQHLFAPFVVLASLAETSSSFGKTGWPEAIFTAGEQLQITPEIRSVFLQNPGSRLHNFYGPTEAHVVSNYSLEDDPNEWSLLPPIGTPIWNTQLYILDPSLNPVPDGIVGELYISGSCLARGYLNRPALTSERFIACPFGEAGSRMYRSGDLVRRSKGQIHYLGRIDQQIKLRGFRVELAEIEASLLRDFSFFATVAVIAREINGINNLIAYCTLYKDLLMPNDIALKSTLAINLPDYMIPSYFVEMETLPLTQSGKLDRSALPTPEAQSHARAYREPQTKNEILLCQLFAEITGRDQVSADDNFFVLGGHSLLAMRLVAWLRSRHDIVIPLRTLFEFSTPESLAPHLESIDSDSDEPMLVRGAGRMTEI